MSALCRHPFRIVGRMLWLLAEFALAALDFLRSCGPNASLVERARWLQRSSRRVFHVLRPTIQVSGTVPARGLLVSNHLSYLDIVLISSITPSIFVAKHEISGWPVFSWFAKMGGTLFVDRGRRATVGQTSDEIQSALEQGVLVVLFPEGTSSNGQTVLPFKSSLLEPATRQTRSLFAGVIHYQIEDGDVAEEVCYWKDMKMLPHAINLLSKRSIHASVTFTQLHECSTDRKELARQLHSEVLRLKESAAY